MKEFSEKGETMCDNGHECAEFLVGGDWNMFFLNFPMIIGKFIIPTDSYFSEELKAPTRNDIESY